MEKPLSTTSLLASPVFFVVKHDCCFRPCVLHMSIQAFPDGQQYGSQRRVVTISPQDIAALSGFQPSAQTQVCCFCAQLTRGIFLVPSVVAVASLCSAEINISGVRAGFSGVSRHVWLSDCLGPLFLLVTQCWFCVVFRVNLTSVICSNNFAQFDA